ncbi:MAG: mechanosensitive ion channel [Bacteroidales bacterium]|nr:mechanosensitive ion channel [Bacteroidales bacterium]
MNDMIEYFGRENLKLMIASVSFAVLLLILFFVYRIVFKFLRKRVSATPGKLDDFILDLFKIPALWMIYWILFKIFSHIYLSEFSFFSILQHVNSILLIFSFGWISIQFVKAGVYFLQSKLDVGSSDNLKARRSLTQINVFKSIANTIVIILVIALSLMTFEQARSLGISMLTSAGVLGLIVGLAAQHSIGMILSGIQLAFTQPIRLDDVVIVEGEWGKIEEITLTYVVVKIWDERRLILPVTWFLDKPFQNWTRSASQILGTISLFVDYSLPVDKIREKLKALLVGNEDWDGRVMNVQVTNSTERNMELRILVSSADASKNWDLKVYLREQMINFINVNYPESFAKVRIAPNGNMVESTSEI